MIFIHLAALSGILLMGACLIASKRNRPAPGTGCLAALFLAALALRLAAARLFQGDEDKLPLILDDSFVLYDEDRLRSALRWLCGNYKGQILMFTCHQREARVLEDSGIQHHLIRL